MTSNLLLLAITALDGGVLSFYRASLTQRIVGPVARIFCPGQKIAEPGLNTSSPGSR